MEHSKDQKRITEEFKMRGDWKDQSKQLKNRYIQLTDEDLKFEEGKEYELLKRIQTRLNKNRVDAIGVIRSVQPEKI
ncbi:hypothetical protein FNH22_30915 [Fulvivirga sp. M361]|uniref:hypothetical protein n=1 Tax=Fulvivirga sp. M361 TaxID=2594266 RepID=UPI001179E895|nr:hypothetical protein [Fulvivirga sp. M361]TRX46406.1 hypothetical protein FNH22_30915 [Fulvivirga sp. M361]